MSKRSRLQQQAGAASGYTRAELIAAERARQRRVAWDDVAEARYRVEAEALFWSDDVKQREQYWEDHPIIGDDTMGHFTYGYMYDHYPREISRVANALMVPPAERFNNYSRGWLVVLRGWYATYNEAYRPAVIASLSNFPGLSNSVDVIMEYLCMPFDMFLVKMFRTLKPRRAPPGQSRSRYRYVSI
ncbi:hypothetical protein [Crucivirus-298]|nr:hypothetical protein [Crucivirus-298]